MASKNGTKTTASSSTPPPRETYLEAFMRYNKVDVKYLKQKASEGSSVAAGVLEALYSCLRVLNFWEGRDKIFESQTTYLMNMTYDCLAHDYQIFTIPQDIMEALKQILDPLYEKSYWPKGEMEMKARLCYARFSCDNDGCPDPAEHEMSMPSIGIELLKQGVEMYPDNFHYYKLLLTALGVLEDYKSASVYIAKGLEKFPDNAHLLYFKVLVTQTKQADNEVTRDDFTAVFQDYLDKAPEHHPSIPKAYYHMALTYSKELFKPNGKNMMEHYYKLGLEAEKKMLPLHFENGWLFLREAVEALLGVYTDRLAEEFQRVLNEPDIPGRTTVAVCQPYMDNPNRIQLIISFRRQLMNEMKQMANDSVQLPKGTPKLKQTYPNKWPLLKSITLKEMNPKTDTIYEGFSISLTITEEPIVKSGLIQVIGRDDDWNMTRVFIYYKGEGGSEMDKIGLGRRISFLNPYVQVVGHEDTGIALRNDEPKCIKYLLEIPNMCRFCWRANAPLKCSQCKKASYCSKNCQLHDWKLLKHKLICSKSNSKNGRWSSS